MREQVEVKRAHRMRDHPHRVHAGVVGLEFQPAQTDDRVTRQADVKQLDRGRRRGFDHAHPVDEFPHRDQRGLTAHDLAQMARRAQNSG